MLKGLVSEQNAKHPSKEVQEVAVESILGLVYF